LGLKIRDKLILTFSLKHDILEENKFVVSNPLNSFQMFTKAYHESILDIIEQCPDEKTALLTVANIITKTKCPQNHDKILEAYKRKIGRSPFSANDCCVPQVEEVLMEEKEAMEKKGAEKAS